MVVGAKERVERARKNVVARGGQETEGAGRVPGGNRERRMPVTVRWSPHVRSP